MISLEDVYIVGKPSASPQQTDFHLDSIPNFALPEGYLEYFQILGKGEFFRNIEVLSQHRFQQAYESWLYIVGLWENEAEVTWWDTTILSYEIAKKSYPIADSQDRTFYLYNPIEQSYYYFSDEGDVTVFKGSFIDAMKVFTQPYNQTDIDKIPFTTYYSGTLAYILIEPEDFDMSFDNLKRNSLLFYPNPELYDVICQFVQDMNLHNSLEKFEYFSIFYIPSISGIITIDDFGGGEIQIMLIADRSKPNIDLIKQKFCKPFLALGIEVE